MNKALFNVRKAFAFYSTFLQKHSVLILLFVLWSMSGLGQTNPTAQNLPYSQNFGTTTFTSMPTGMAAWNGMNGGSVTTQALAESTSPSGDALITAATSNQSGGGIYGYATSSNGRVYIQTSSNSTNGVNQIALAINTTGKGSIVVSYDLEIINPGANRTVGVVLQYRIGNSGGWSAVTGTNNPFSQSGGTAGSKGTATVNLPAACNNQSVVQLRWAIWRGTENGNSSGIGIDNINVNSSCNVPVLSSTTTNVSCLNGTNGAINLNVVAPAYSGFTYDGNINEYVWGSPLATSAGGAAPGFGVGHEINALYATADATFVNVAIAGNIQVNNRILLFIDSKSGGYSNGSFGRGSAPQGIDDFNSGTSFDAGFLPDYCLVIGTNGSGGYFYDLFTLSSTGSSTFLGAAGASGLGASPANSIITRGFEARIASSALGYTGGNVKFFAAYIADGGFLSNQFLTRANFGEDNYGSGAVNFGAAAPNPIDLYNYSWTRTGGGFTASTEDISNLTAGTYNVTVTGNSICSTTGFFAVSQPVAILSAASSNSPVCAGSTLSLTAANASGGSGSGYSYSWTGPNGFTSNDQNPSISNIQSNGGGVYTLTVRDGNNCEATFTTNVTVNPIVTPSVTIAASSLTVCSGASVTVTPTPTNGGSSPSYEWFKNGVSQGNSATFMFNPANGDQVYAVLTSSANCASPTTVTSSTLTFNVNLSTSFAGVVTPVTCNGGNTGAIAINLSSAVTFDGNINNSEWGAPFATSAGGPASQFGANRLDALYARRAGNNLNLALAGRIQDDNRILVFIDSKAGGYNSLGGWTNRTNAPYNSIENLNNGISFDAGFDADYVLGINEFGGTVYYDLYDMPGNSNSASSVISQAYISNTGTGDFTKGFEFALPLSAIGNPTGSVKVFVMIVNSPDESSATFLSNQFLTRANNGDGNYGNGAVTFGAAAPDPLTINAVSYSWSNGATTKDISGLTAGNYTLTITNEAGCQSSQPFTITQPDAVVANAGSNVSVCEGGTVQLNGSATGGNGTYTYAWTGPNSFNSVLQNPSFTASALSAGTYNLIATDGNGCTSLQASVSVTVTSVTAPVVTSPVIYCKDATAAALSATATSGNSLLWYTVPTGGTGASLAPTPSTTTAGSTSYFVSQAIPTGNLKIAIVGRTTNSDQFAFVALNPIPAGTVIYFTDNGWTGSQFRGASATDGDGNEQLTRFTANNLIPAGTVVISYTSSVNYTWATSGAIGSTGENYSALAISASGEQIYAFTATDPNNPLFTPLQHLFVFDDSNGFENAADPSTGNIPPGLTLGVTANTFAFGGSSFNYVDVENDNSLKTIAQWYAFIANASNYVSGSTGTLASVPYNVIAEYGCESPRSEIVVTINARPTAVLSGDATICSGQSTNLSVTLTGTAPWNFKVNGVSYTANESPYLISVSPTTTTNYTLTDLGDANCAASTGDITGDADVTVNTAPTVSATDITGINSSAGNCSAEVSFGTNVTVTGTPAPTLVYKIGTNVITSPYVFPVGSTIVTVDATNDCGSASSTFTVTIVDKQNPVTTLPTVAASYNADNGACYAALTLTATATDNCGIASIKYYINYGTGTEAEISFPYNFTVGVTVVTVVATDVNNNTDTDTYTVVVVDNQNPVITLPTVAASYSADAGDCDATLTLTATATDNCGIASIKYYINYGTGSQAEISFPYNFPVGSTTVTVVATDVNNLTDVDSYTVVVEDKQNPVTTLPTVATSYNADNGACHAALTLTATATDNCGTPALKYYINYGTGSQAAISFPYNFPVGSTIVTVVATDVNGLTDTDTYTVKVVDNQNPVTILPTVATSYNMDAGECRARLTLEASATDNCSIASIKYYINYGTGTEAEISFPYNFTVGSTVVTVVATDVNNNTDTDTYTVVVVDNQNPVITLPTVAASYTADAGDCDATLTLAATATDNCGIASIKYYINYGTGTEAAISFPYNFPVGSTTVTVVATDVNNLTDVDSYTVVVEDTQNPVTTLPTVAAFYTADAGDCDATLTLTATATDNCGIASIKYYINYSTGTEAAISFPYNFPVGSTTVTVVATDVNNLTDVDSYTVVVKDTQNPVTTLPTVALSYNMDAGECRARLTLEATATDNCGTPALKYYINYGTDSQAEISFPYNFTVGSTMVTVVATDVNGLTDTDTYTVKVVDNQNPVTTLPTVALSYNMDAGECHARLTLTATATDNCSVASIKYYINYGTDSQVEISFPYNFTVGSTMVTVVATDVNGLTDTDTYTVTVTDNQPPATTLPTVGSSYNMDAGECRARLTLTATATDNCSVASIKYYINYGTDSQVEISFPYDFTVGATTVTVVATDVNGLTDVDSYTVNVLDNQNPVINLPNVAASYNTDAGECNRTLSFTANASDNCSVSSIKYYVGTTEISFPYDFEFGITTVTVNAVDANGNETTSSFNVNVNKVTTITTLSVSPTSQQYSDRVTFTASIQPANCSGAGDVGGTVDFKIGSFTIAAAVPVVNGVATITVPLLETSLDGTLPPNPPAGALASYPFSVQDKIVSAVVTGTDADYLISNPSNKTLKITQEDARLDYIGTMAQATPSITTSTATVQLQATVLDITALPGSSDNLAGDIRNARVMFVNRDAGNAPLSGWMTPSLIDPSDSKIGVVTANYTFDIGNANANSYTVGIIVDNGYYLRNEPSDNVVVTVYKPLGDFVTGGGYIVPSQSSGTYASTPGLKMNFGLNVKFNKRGTNLQGGVNMIFRRNVGGVVRTYQIKSNSMTSLGVSGTSDVRLAEFLSKSNLTDITNPLSPVSLGGNLDLRVIMTDKGEPGSNDEIGVTLFAGNGSLLFSSNWVLSSTQKIILSGGNIVVRSDQFAPSVKIGAITVKPSPDQKTIQAAADFNVKVLGNPSLSTFRLQLQSSDKQQKITVKIVDVSGRIVEVKENLYAGQVIEVGAKYTQGTYFAEVLQGTNRKTVKLLKVARD